jgi:hypothetical protein
MFLRYILRLNGICGVILALAHALTSNVIVHFSNSFDLSWRVAILWSKILFHFSHQVNVRSDISVLQ